MTKCESSCDGTCNVLIFAERQDKLLKEARKLRNMINGEGDFGELNDYSALEKVAQGLDEKAEELQKTINNQACNMCPYSTRRRSIAY